MKRALVCLFLIACKGSSDAPSSPAPTAAAATAPAHPTTFVTPLGAPDLIEPPTRDIVPGMTVAEAKARGAKPGEYGHLLAWRPDIDVWVDQKAQLVTSLQVTYPKPAWDAMRAKWGEPKIAKAWLGANWVATLNGCSVGCTLMFMRTPAAMFGDSAAPPLALANLRDGMTPEQAHAATGVAVDDSFELGYGFTASVGFDGDKLTEVDISMRRGKDFGGLREWLPTLTGKWGKPVELDGKDAWIGTHEHWIAVANHSRDQLELTPYRPIAELVAKTGDGSVLGFAKAALGAPRTGLAKLPHYDAKTEDVTFARSELSLDTPEVSLELDDNDVVTSVTVTMPGDPAKLMGLLARSWGAPTKRRTEDGDEVTTIAVDGLTATVEERDRDVHLVVTR